MMILVINVPLIVIFWVVSHCAWRTGFLLLLGTVPWFPSHRCELVCRIPYKTASFICTSWFGDSSLGSGFCWGRIKHHIHNQTNIFLSFVLGASTSQPHLSLNVTKRDVNSFLCLFLLHKASAGKRLCFFRLGGSLDISSWTQFY